MYEEALSNTQYGPYWGSYLERDANGFFPELWQSLRSLWNYHQDVYTFHTQFLNDATHTYQSKPQWWLVVQPPGGDAGRPRHPARRPGLRRRPRTSTCLRQVLLLGTPVLWWGGGGGARATSAYAWIARRDWRYGLVVVGVASTLAALVPLRRPADLLLLRGLDPAVHDHRG